MKFARRQFLNMAAGAAALPALSPAATHAQGTKIAANAAMIVERTHYFAKPGSATEVLDLRRKACAVRLSMGLPTGEIFIKHPRGDGSEPDVAWQCTFTDATAREADLAARAASTEFQNVVAQMLKQIVRFDRQVFSVATI